VLTEPIYGSVWTGLVLNSDLGLLYLGPAPLGSIGPNMCRCIKFPVREAELPSQRAGIGHQHQKGGRGGTNKQRGHRIEGLQERKVNGSKAVGTDWENSPKSTGEGVSKRGKRRERLRFTRTQGPTHCPNDEAITELEVGLKHACRSSHRANPSEIQHSLTGRCVKGVDSYHLTFIQWSYHLKSAL